MAIRKFRNLVCALIVIASFGAGGAYIAKAGNTYLNVTVSNMPGSPSPDPYSLVEPKDDSDSKFYITLYTLTGASSIHFTAYKTYGNGTNHNLSIDTQASLTKTMYDTNLGTTMPKAYYTGYAIAGQRYYLYSEPVGYGYNINAVGHYCP